MSTYICRTNKANGNRTESEPERLRENIDRLLDRLTTDELKGTEVFLYNYFGLEALNERQN